MFTVVAFLVSVWSFRASFQHWVTDHVNMMELMHSGFMPTIYFLECNLQRLRIDIFTIVGNYCKESLPCSNSNPVTRHVHINTSGMYTADFHLVRLKYACFYFI